LKGYAILNAIAGVILALVVTNGLKSGAGLIAFSIIAVVAIASFSIYAFGEVVQLLQDIKDNTAQQPKFITPAAPTPTPTPTQRPKNEELPSI
jgi:hypothetical protein